VPKSDAMTVRELDRKVRVLIADDHPVIRSMVRSTLQLHPKFEICGEVEDGGQAVERKRRN
jgi:DNA-binding NarL/FixJ family response regulator